MNTEGERGEGLGITTVFRILTALSFASGLLITALAIDVVEHRFWEPVPDQTFSKEKGMLTAIAPQTGLTDASPTAQHSRPFRTQDHQKAVLEAARTGQAPALAIASPMPEKVSKLPFSKGEWITLALLPCGLAMTAFVIWTDLRWIRPLEERIKDMWEESLQTGTDSAEPAPQGPWLLETGRLHQIAERHRTQSQRNENTRRLLHREIVVDPLTQLFNRKGFEIVSRRIVSMLSRSQSSASVMMIDVDHFKSVNDLHGHVSGDFVLASVANSMRMMNRYGDIFSRYGGDEFLLLSANCDAVAATTHAERIRQAISELEIPLPQGTHFRVSVSIGVATFLASRSALSGAILRADAMLYEAKRQGRNQVCSDTRTDANGSWIGQRTAPTLHVVQ